MLFLNFFQVPIALKFNNREDTKKNSERIEYTFCNCEYVSMF